MFFRVKKSLKSYRNYTLKHHRRFGYQIPTLIMTSVLLFPFLFFLIIILKTIIIIFHQTIIKHKTDNKLRIKVNYNLMKSYFNYETLGDTRISIQ